MTTRTLYWGLFGVTMAVYATMLAWSLPAVSAAAGGLAPFDMRPSGYSLDEARAFLAALTSEGADFYRNVQQRLDIAFPALIALTLGFGIVGLLPRRLGAWRWLGLAVALPVAVFDYLENHAVARMIEAGAAGLTAELVAAASQWTVLKSMATSIVMTGLLVVIVARLAVRFWPVARRSA